LPALAIIFSQQGESVITNYEIVTATRVADLQDRVLERIKDGWQPSGGISMLHEDDAVSRKPHIVFAQAVVLNA
jgi:Domain of unknown function (DUF1737)